MTKPVSEALAITFECSLSKSHYSICMFRRRWERTAVRTFAYSRQWILRRRLKALDETHELQALQYQPHRRSLDSGTPIINNNPTYPSPVTGKASERSIYVKIPDPTTPFRQPENVSPLSDVGDEEINEGGSVESDW
jgi:hypothetical protein